MPCKFPFIHNGVSYNKCTNAKLPPDGAPLEYDESEETLEAEEAPFFWCATLTDSDSNMVWWGQCDMSECENGKLS